MYKDFWTWRRLICSEVDMESAVTSCYKPYVCTVIFPQLLKFIIKGNKRFHVENKIKTDGE